MVDELKILILEDVATDAELMERALRQDNIPFTARHVSDRDNFLHAVEGFQPDVILADVRLPHYAGQDALKHIRKHHPQIPMVMVTGSLGDEAAIELIKSGAKDYVLKGNLARLPFAVRRALAEEKGIRARKAAEQALREREAFYHAILEDLPALICRWKRNGIISYVNDYYCRYFGKRQEDLIGHNFMPLVHELDWPKIESYLTTLDKAKTVGTIVHRTVGADGNIRWLRWMDRPLLDDAGNIQEFQSTGWDITDQIKAEDEIRDLARFPNENPNPVMRIDRRGRLMFHNTASAPLLLPGTTRVPESWLPPVIIALDSGRTNNFEVEQDGRSYDFTVAPFASAGYANLYGQDITERKRLEQLGLESEIAARMAEGVQLTRAQDGVIVYTNPSFDAMFGYAEGELFGRHVSLLNAPNDESAEEAVDKIGNALLRADLWEGDVHSRRKDGSEFWSHATVSNFDHPQHGRVWLSVHLDVTERRLVEHMKDELVATVSHELRTPLTTLLGFVELLRNRKLSRDRQQELLSIVEQEGQRLGQLLNDFLDIQRIQTGRQEYRCQTIDIASLLRKALRVYAASDTQHVLHDAIPDDLPSLYADPDRLRQVLDNLLSNAIKFSPAGGDITLGAQAEANHVLVWVTDQGLGIPADAITRLFTKFYRVDTPETSGIRGTGLGLALVREIIEAHHGEIWVDSTVGQGSTFYFSLPLGAPAPGD